MQSRDSLRRPGPGKPDPGRPGTLEDWKPYKSKSENTERD